MKSERTAKELAALLVSEFEGKHAGDGQEDRAVPGTVFPGSWIAVAEAAAQALGVELAPERPAAEKRPEWWGRPIPGHADPYYSTVDTLALVDAYEAARKAGVLPGLEAQDREWKGRDPRLRTPEETERAIEAYETARNRAMADLTFGEGGVAWCEKAEPAAPERPALPGWAEAGVRMQHGVVLSFVVEEEGLHRALIEVQWRYADDLAALVEVHRRWLAAKRLLEGEPVNPPLTLAERAVLAILRGEDRA